MQYKETTTLLRETSAFNHVSVKQVLQWSRNPGCRLYFLLFSFNLRKALHASSAKRVSESALAAKKIC